MYVRSTDRLIAKLVLLVYNERSKAFAIVARGIFMLQRDKLPSFPF